jgi:hypothetical protein
VVARRERGWVLPPAANGAAMEAGQSLDRADSDADPAGRRRIDASGETPPEGSE